VQAQVNGYRVSAHEIRPGIVYKDENLSVKAFLVNHGDVPQAFGYRFETPDRTIVISGDASPSQSIVDNCDGCDVLNHEAYSMMTYESVSPKYQEYRRKHHTSSRELAELAKKARPDLLILYHRANPGGVGRPDPEEVVVKPCRLQACLLRDLQRAEPTGKRQPMSGKRDDEPKRQRRRARGEIGAKSSTIWSSGRQ
jgi:hypothetical protein